MELQFTTNVLGYHWLTRYMLEDGALGEIAKNDQGSDIDQQVKIRGARSCKFRALPLTFYPRVVYVASFFAGNLDLSDVEFKTRPYHNIAAYQASKQ